MFLVPGPLRAKGNSACILFNAAAGNLPVRPTHFKEVKFDLDEAWTYEPHHGKLSPSTHRHTSQQSRNRLNFQYGDRLHDKLDKNLQIWDGITFVDAEGFKFHKSKAPITEK